MSLKDFVLIRVRAGKVHGLLGKYYAWKDNPPEEITKLPALDERIDERINFVWIDSPTPKVPTENFAVAWEGYLIAPMEGDYIFFLETDDGARLWIDSKLVIDSWWDQPPTVHHSPRIRLTPGYHLIKLYFYNKETFAVIRLGWIRPDGKAEIIPSTNLAVKLSNEIIVKGLPEDYTIELWAGEKIGSAKVVDGIAKIDANNILQPIDGYFKVHDADGSIVYTSPIIRDIWGGDEYEVAEV